MSQTIVSRISQSLALRSSVAIFLQALDFQVYLWTLPNSIRVQKSETISSLEHC